MVHPASTNWVKLAYVGSPRHVFLPTSSTPLKRFSNGLLCKWQYGLFSLALKFVLSALSQWCTNQISRRPIISTIHRLQRLYFHVKNLKQRSSHGVAYCQFYLHFECNDAEAVDSLSLVYQGVEGHRIDTVKINHFNSIAVT